jgi:hypothetical protein
VLRVSLVAARDDERRGDDRRELCERLERARARHSGERVSNSQRMRVQGEPLPDDGRHRLAPGARHALEVVGLEEAVDPPLAQRQRQRIPVREGGVEAIRVVAGRHERKCGYALGIVEREAERRVGAHRRPDEHRPVELERVEESPKVAGKRRI